MSTVTVDAETASLLVAGCFEHLAANALADGCCPLCCGPCKALISLLFAGQLDGLARLPSTFGDVSWWNYASDGVDRDWLRRAWRVTNCHEATS